VDPDTERTEPTHSLSDTADTPLALFPSDAAPREPVGPRRPNAIARFDWFDEHRPSGGLTLDVYNLVRYSGQARVAVVDAIVEQYLQDADVDALLRDVGLASEEIARDQASADVVALPVSPAEEQYRRLCGIAGRALELGARLRKARVILDYMRSGSSRQAALIRSEGHCENLRCTGESTSPPTMIPRSWLTSWKWSTP
jgi:hypothetical protein